MGFSKKIQDFFNEKGLNNREISKIMDGYSESMISKYINSDKVSVTFIQLLIEYFPEIDLNKLLKDEDVLDTLEEEKEDYKTKGMYLIEEIESKIIELKSVLAR